MTAGSHVFAAAVHRNRRRMVAVPTALALVLAMLVTPAAAASPMNQGDGIVYDLIPGPSPWGLVPGSEIEGASASIHRTASGVTLNIHTTELDPDHVYTVWVFEVNCATCSHPVQLAGHKIGDSGVGNFSGRLHLSNDPTEPVQDPMEGDFHAVLADHGELDPSEMPAAIKSGVPPFLAGVQNWDQVVIFAP